MRACIYYARDVIAILAEGGVLGFFFAEFKGVYGGVWWLHFATIVIAGVVFGESSGKRNRRKYMFFCERCRMEKIKTW